MRKDMETLTNNKKTKMRHAQNEKGKWNGIELPNRERIIGENENYKYLGFLEADTIKQTEMNEK